MKMSLRPTTKEDDPHTVLLPACIDRRTTVCCTLYLSVHRPESSHMPFKVHKNKSHRTSHAPPLITQISLGGSSLPRSGQTGWV